MNLNELENNRQENGNFQDDNTNQGQEKQSAAVDHSFTNNAEPDYGDDLNINEIDTENLDNENLGNETFDDEELNNEGFEDEFDTEDDNDEFGNEELDDEGLDDLDSEERTDSNSSL
ncbi:hypothetical protein KHA90_10820 [Flavobacterium psychroterrae]|jgi:hypothetical protein|uniref:Uncharacterized protein n=1 Tax=Flavobacterium psychroterrae TaxID=2133767 RepID=A0ABS5PCD8_9FLAO|nr:hypothetical protein [Flavobacterium psychroterrae]MBS7231515.1 hypothetical protein [Flavobacterium psychroterrae]